MDTKCSLQKRCRDCGGPRDYPGQGRCHVCYNKVCREKYAKDDVWRKEKIRKRKALIAEKKQRGTYVSTVLRPNWRIQLKTKYGLTEEQYLQLYAAQNGKCAICFDSLPILNVDHDHRKGFVRGLLCPKCNRGLGMFRENPEALRRAAAYLNRFTAVKLSSP